MSPVKLQCWSDRPGVPIKKVSLSSHLEFESETLFLFLLSLLLLHLPTVAANAIAVSMVLSRLDYCNSCLWGVPSQQLKRLQLVQNSRKNCHSYTEMRPHYPSLQRAAFVAG